MDADTIFWAKRKEENRQAQLLLAHLWATGNKDKEHDYLSSGKDGESKEENGDIQVFSISKPVK